MDSKLSARPQNKLPFAGKRIVVTRARSQARSLARSIEELGGAVIEFPTIEIQPAGDFSALDQAIKNIERYQWLMFTSVNGVKFFFERLDRLNVDKEKLASLRFAAIGPETARRLEEAGVKDCLVPRSYRAEGILEMLEPETMLERRVLIPRAAKARELLPETLRRWGARVDVVETYRTAIPNTDTGKLLNALRRREIDMVTFTSSSTVVNFAKLFGGQALTKILGEAPIACIGPVTEQTVMDLGGIVAVSAREFTIAGLIRAMVDYFREPCGDTDVAAEAEC
jgi:uroporphyrinogen III methyltransferase/synthase